MKTFPALAAGVLALVSSASADILISQYYEGSSSNKWIELTNTDVAPVSLDGYVLTSWSNAVTEAWKTGGGSPTNSEDLTGFSIPGGGYFLIANANAALPAYATGNVSSTVTFFNGNDSVVLYDTALGLAGDPVAVVDAVSFTEASTAPGNETSFYRLTNDPGFNFDLGSTVLDFPAVWGEKTPAEVDSAVEADPWYLQGFATDDALTVTLSTASVAENDGAGVVDVTVERTGDTTAALEVTLSSSDESEAIVVTASVQIPAGEVSETFLMAVDAVDDLLADGTQTVTLTATATGFTEGTADLDVTDNGDVESIVFNELLADPPDGLAGDANGDGVRDSGDDEFVELVNVSGAPLDISFWEITDAGGTRHVFAAGTVVPVDCAVVVFGGGFTSNLGGTALYEVATGNFLGLSNSSDSLTLRDDLGQARAEVAYTAGAGSNESLTRDPDLTGAFVGHTGAIGSGGEAYSPGALIDGSQFCAGVGELSISLSTSTISENGGTLTATITRTGDLTNELDVIISIDDPSEAEAFLILPPFATILATEATVEVIVNGVDDIAPDGVQVVTITAAAPDYAPGEAQFNVEDDGDGVFDSLVINEILYDPPGDASGDANGDGTRDGTADEFVELLNVSGAEFDLSELELHDGFGLRHIFPPGTILAADQAIVVFGGPSPTGFFGGSIVQIAGSGSLGLNNGGDSVILKDSSGGELLRVDYDGSVQDEALTRDPDGSGALVAHSAATDSGGALFSPGNQIDGAAFPGGSTAPTGIVLESIDFDFGSNLVVVSLSGLQAGVSYDFESSLDLGGTDFWIPIDFFSTTDGVEISPGVFQFVFSDATIASESAQFYRANQP